MLPILLLVLAQVQLTNDSLFVVGDPYIDNGYVYFQASTEVLSSKATNDMGTLYTYAHSNPELTVTSTGETFELELPDYADTMIISGALSRIERELDGAWLIAVGDKAGYTYLWRYQFLRPQYLGSILIPNPTQITALSFSHQATKVLIGTEYGRVFRYNIPIAPWIVEYTSGGWHPEDDGYTKLYPIRVEFGTPNAVQKRDALAKFGAGLILRLNTLGDTAVNDCLIVHVTSNASTTGLPARQANIWVLTKGANPASVANYAYMRLYGLPGYGPTIQLQKIPDPVPQKTRPMLFTYDTLYNGGTLGRSAMTCLSVDDATYYKLNIDDGYTATRGGMNIFRKETVSGKVRYFGAYRTETPATYTLPNYVYKFLRTQSTFNLCDGDTYQIYTWRNILSGIDVEPRPEAVTDDVIQYSRCDGSCPGYLPIDESKNLTPEEDWKLFEVPKQDVYGVSYDISLTEGYNFWILIGTPEENPFNNLYLVLDEVAFCATQNCAGATYVDVNLLQNENFGEPVIYANLIPQACNPYCLEIVTNYADKPILELSTQETDFVRVNQKVLRQDGLWGFSPDRWSEEFSITNGARKPGSLDWDFGTWTVDWPTGKGFDLAWYKINLLDPSFTIEGEGESPLSETIRKPGQIGPFVRVQYYKTSDGFSSIVKDSGDDDIIQIPGNIDIFDIITKERPYIVYRRADVPGNNGLLGTYVALLEAIIVHWDENGTYFLGENPPPSTGTFEIDLVTYDCADGFLPASDLRFFDYPGAMPPGIYPDCVTGQDCVSTTALPGLQIFNIIQSETSGLWFLTDLSGLLTVDHCGIEGNGIVTDYGYEVHSATTPVANQGILIANLGKNIPELTTTGVDAMLCASLVIGPDSLFFYVTQGTPAASGTFVLDGTTFTFTNGGVPSLVSEIYLTEHEDLLDEICVPDDCYTGGRDCVTIPVTAQVFPIPEEFKTGNTWDDGYDYALVSKEPLNLTEDHCFTRGLAFPGRSTGGKYVAQMICADAGAAELVRTAIYSSHRGDQELHTGGGDVLMAYVERVDNRVYIYTLCAPTLPGYGDTVTFGGYDFTAFTYSINAFEAWTYSFPTPGASSCISSATEIFRLDQTAQEFEGEIISSKVDLTGYDEVVGQRKYFSTDETLIDIPWAGSFYDIMWLSPVDDYEIWRTFPDPHFVSPQFSQEGETIYEKNVDVDYGFAAVDNYVGALPVYHTEGETDYVGGYPPLPGEPAELYVMEGEVTEGEIFAVPECTLSPPGTDCIPWDTDAVIFQTPLGGYCVSVPGSGPTGLVTPSVYSERHCGLGPIYPAYTKTPYMYTIDDGAIGEAGAARVILYTDKLGHTAIGGDIPSGEKFFLARVAVNGNDILLYIVHLTEPSKAGYQMPTYEISFITGETLILSSSTVYPAYNTFEVYTYDFGFYEPDQLCILGAYTNRNIAPNAVASTVFRSPMGNYNILSDTVTHSPLDEGITAVETNRNFIPAGTTKLKLSLGAVPQLYDLFEGMLGRNYANTEGQYYIFAYLEVVSGDLVCYFLNIGGTAVPIPYFVDMINLQIAFVDYPITSATGEFFVYKYTEKVAPIHLSQASLTAVAANGTQVYRDNNSQGYAFNTTYPALEYARGTGGEPFRYWAKEGGVWVEKPSEWEKVYIDYTNVAGMTAQLDDWDVIPYIGYRQTSAPVDHMIVGYELREANTILRVFFLVGPNDACITTPPTPTPINLGAPFPGKTAADRVATDFYIVYYDNKTTGDKESLNPAVPYPPEYYGWDCIDTSDMFIYRNFTDVTWIVSSDTTIVTDYRSPVIGLKDDITVGYVSYSRTYGPYLQESEFDARYTILRQNLGLNIRTIEDPVVITHLRKMGNEIKVFYLIEIDASSNVDPYDLGEYEFPMSLLALDDDYDIVAYDSPALPSRLCKDWYSEKIESTENFTVGGGYTSSTEDLRGYTGLTRETFATDNVPLYYNLSISDNAEFNIFLPSLYSVPSSFTDAYISDNTWDYEQLSTVFYKDMNLFGTVLLPPLYHVYPGGGTTETRFDDTVYIYTFNTALASYLPEWRALIGKAIEVTWPGGSAPAILSEAYYFLGFTRLSAVMMREFETPIPSTIEILGVGAPQGYTVGSLSTTYMKYFKFNSPTYIGALGYNALTNIIGATTLTPTSPTTISVFYLEGTDTYYGLYYGATALPTGVTSVTWATGGVKPVTNFTPLALNDFRKFTITNPNPPYNINEYIVCGRFATPATWTYDILDTTYQDPGLFTKQVNIVEYEDYYFTGDPIVFNNAVPELGYHITVDTPQYLRFDPVTMTVSDGEEGETLIEGDVYTTAKEVYAEGELYVNFNVEADVSEASPGYKSIYIGEDVHTLERCKGPEKPLNYASFGWCDFVTPVEIDKEDLYAHTYEHQDYTIFLKNGTLYSHPSEGYNDPAYTWVTTEPEAFDIIMEWIDASENVKEFFRVYLAVDGTTCQNGTWESPFEIPDNCDNVVSGLDVSLILGEFDDAYTANVIIDDYTISEGVQKFWVTEDNVHLGLPAFMTLAEFDVVSTSVADEYEVVDTTWFKNACREMWYYQTVPVADYEYYFEQDEGDLSMPFNEVRVKTYMPLIVQIVPINVALDVLRLQIQDWQRPNLDRLSIEAPTATSLRNLFIEAFILRTTDEYSIADGYWGLINMLEPVAFSAPLVVYLAGNGNFVVNNIWGTMPQTRFSTDPHVGEGYADVVRTNNNNLTIKGPKRLLYGALAGTESLIAIPEGPLPDYGRLESNTVVFDTNKAFITGNILDPWASSLYRYTVPSGGGLSFTWPREFMSSSNLRTDDPPGYIIICE